MKLKEKAGILAAIRDRKPLKVQVGVAAAEPDKAMKAVLEIRTELVGVRQLVDFKMLQLQEAVVIAVQKRVVVDKLLEAQRLEAQQVVCAGGAPNTLQART